MSDGSSVVSAESDGGSVASPSVQPYHEPQYDQRCGLHALRCALHALGAPRLDALDAALLNEIGARLDASEMLIGARGAQDPSAHFSMSGDYSVQVLSLGAEAFGAELEPLAAAQFADVPIGAVPGAAYVVHSNAGQRGGGSSGHWRAVVESAGSWWDVDSLARRPARIDLLEALQGVPRDSVFVVRRLPVGLGSLRGGGRSRSRSRSRSREAGGRGGGRAGEGNGGRGCAKGGASDCALATSLCRSDALSIARRGQILGVDRMHFWPAEDSFYV